VRYVLAPLGRVGTTEIVAHPGLLAKELHALGFTRAQKFHADHIRLDTRFSDALTVLDRVGFFGFGWNITIQGQYCFTRQQINAVSGASSKRLHRRMNLALVFFKYHWKTRQIHLFHRFDPTLPAVTIQTLEIPHPH
jgi:hypothetical protein